MSPFLPLLIFLGILGLFVLAALVRSVRVVPAKTALVVERLGKYARTLEAGFHLLLPFLDVVKYRHNLKEQAIDVPSQPCITLDNVRVEVDGVLYFQVVDPRKASYGINDYKYATIQLAQTTMRSIIGKLELDRTFEDRTNINIAILQSVDEAAEPWGVNVTRYEIQNIRVPENVLKSMEGQMRSEREKRATIARSEGEMESRINYSIGVMEEAINRSEGQKERQINEAEGQASEILAVSRATAEGLSKLAEALEPEGGEEAVTLRVAEEYFTQLARAAREGTRVVLPLNLADLGSMLAAVRRLIGGGGDQS